MRIRIRLHLALGQDRRIKASKGSEEETQAQTLKKSKEAEKNLTL